MSSTNELESHTFTQKSVLFIQKFRQLNVVRNPADPTNCDKRFAIVGENHRSIDCSNEFHQRWIKCKSVVSLWPWISLFMVNPACIKWDENREHWIKMVKTEQKWLLICANRIVLLHWLNCCTRDIFWNSLSLFSLTYLNFLQFYSFISSNFLRIIWQPFNGKWIVSSNSTSPNMWHKFFNVVCKCGLRFIESTMKENYCQLGDLALLISVNVTCEQFHHKTLTDCNLCHRTYICSTFSAGFCGVNLKSFSSFYDN